MVHHDDETRDQVERGEPPATADGGSVTSTTVEEDESATEVVDDPFAERGANLNARTQQQFFTAVATAAVEAAVRARDEVPLDQEGTSRYIEVVGKRARKLGFAYAGKDKFEVFTAALIQMGVFNSSQ